MTKTTAIHQICGNLLETIGCQVSDKNGYFDQSHLSDLEACYTMALVGANKVYRQIAEHVISVYELMDTTHYNVTDSSRSLYQQFKASIDDLRSAIA